MDTPRMDTPRIPVSMFEFKAAGPLVRSDWLLDNTAIGIAQELGLTAAPPVVEVVDAQGAVHSYRLQSASPRALNQREWSWIYVGGRRAPSRVMVIRYWPGRRAA